MRAPTVLVARSQIDVTEQVEAQARLAKMLEQEHKVLEGIYPRHVIEYLTLEGRESVGDGGAGTGAGGRSGNGGDQCLLSLLPGNVARMASLATWHSGVTVLFADIVGESMRDGWWVMDGLWGVRVAVRPTVRGLFASGQGLTTAV